MNLIEQGEIRELFLLTVPRRYIFCGSFVLFMSYVIAALWSPEGKGLTSWLLFVLFIVIFTFPFGILGQVWYLIVSIPDPCCLYDCTCIQCK